MMKPSRRSFLAAAGATTAVASGAFFLQKDPEIDALVEESVRDTLERFLSDHDGADAIGRERIEGGNVDVSALPAQLAAAGSDPNEWFETVSAVDFAEHIRRRVRSDFGAERVVSVGGWILSQTEADLCALWTSMR